jgi:hypothetical protein
MRFNIYITNIFNNSKSDLFTIEIINISFINLQLISHIIIDKK